MDTTMRHAVSEPTAPLEVTTNTTIRDLVDGINAALQAEGLLNLIGESEGLSIFPTLHHGKQVGELPAFGPETTIRALRARWLICYAVPGSNEGEYLTLAAIVQAKVDETPPDLYRGLNDLSRRGVPASVHLTLATGKTFVGMRGAAEAAARISELLERW